MLLYYNQNDANIPTCIKQVQQNNSHFVSIQKPPLHQKQNSKTTDRHLLLLRTYLNFITDRRFTKMTKHKKKDNVRVRSYLTPSFLLILCFFFLLILCFLYSTSFCFQFSSIYVVVYGCGIQCINALQRMREKNRSSYFQIQRYHFLLHIHVSSSTL